LLFNLCNRLHAANGPCKKPIPLPTKQPAPHQPAPPLRLDAADPADVAGACRAAAAAWREVGAELHAQAGRLGKLIGQHEPNGALASALLRWTSDLYRARYECELRARALDQVAP
jgi:hypothetical protein